MEKGIAEGARLRCGGKFGEGDLADGFYYLPTVLDQVKRGMSVVSDEAFGPVVTVETFSTVDEAVEIANDSSFGLSGSVWGKDTAKAERIARRLEVGMTYVNEHGTTKAGLPFGGVRRSGYGRELGRWGFGEFANTKLVRVAK